MCLFHEGDTVRGTINRHYNSACDENMQLAKVVMATGDVRMNIKILEHADPSMIGFEFEVDDRFFELVTPRNTTKYNTEKENQNG